MAEAFTLDGLSLNDTTNYGVTAVDWPPPRQRQDWIGAADSETQLLFRNPLHENRKITMRIVVAPQSTTDLMLAKVAALLDKLQKASRYQDGISLTWQPDGSSLSCTFDVLSGEITNLPVDYENGWFAKSPELTVELTAKPYWRGTETLTSTASSSTPFVTLDVSGVTGDVPALGRLIVTDTASQSRRHVEWGLEGPLTYGVGSYSSGTSLMLDSDSLVTSGFAGAGGTISGAYDPGAVSPSVIGATLYGGQTTALAGTGNQVHVGTFRVKARMYCSIDTLVRFTYRSGDGPTTSNAWVSVTLDQQWQELDLGTITLPVVVSGTQRWTGTVEVQHSVTNAGANLDYLILIPVSDGYGKARATFTYSPGVVTGFDSFASTTAGSALSARSAPAGGSWATSGDATDFAFADGPTSTEESVYRAVASSTSGRFALLGTGTPTDVQVDARIYNDLAPTGTSLSLDMAVVARYVDASNYLYATFRRTSGTTLYKALEIRQVVSGTDTLISSTAFPAATGTSGKWWKITLTAYSNGNVFARIFSDAGVEQVGAIGSSTAVATAGALASGKSGIFDRNKAANTINRYYDDFAVYTPPSEPIVVYSGRNMQFRYDDTIRQDSTGTYTGRPQSYRGGRFLLPVGTSRVAVKARRIDVETAADNFIADATQIQVGWTPRGLAVPR